MPFYDYRCSACGHTLTEMQSMSAAPLTLCPKCQQETLVKLISASGFDLKGVGVFGSSKQPFKNETGSCGANASSTSSASDSSKTTSACASCPHAKNS